MNTHFQRAMLLPTMINGTLTLAAKNIPGFGVEFFNGQVIDHPAWPVGMKNLVNSKNRIGGQFASDENIFFFAGTARDFSAFLEDYANIRGVESHRLVLHRGGGEVVATIGGNQGPCDWKLQGRPGAQFSSSEPNEVRRPANFVLEVHFWTGGKITLSQIVVPQNIQLAGDGPVQFEPGANLLVSADKAAL